MEGGPWNLSLALQLARTVEPNGRATSNHHLKGIETMKKLLHLLFACMLTATVLAAEPVNINTASAEEISQNLKGIGLSKAQAIVEYREANGSFLHVDELVNVKGIGIRTVDQNRDFILLGNTKPTSND